jgi:hypothetical protein
MNTFSVWQDYQRVDALVQRVSSAAQGSPSPEFQADLTYYICIVTSGFLERSLRSIFYEYARKRARPFVANYVEDHLKLFRNPDLERIFQLLGAFNPDWRSKLEAQTKGQIQIAINSVVGQRHRIAHGESVSLNLGSMLGYYKSIVKFVRIVDDLVSETGEPTAI